MYLSCRKAAYDTADPSEGLMNILKKMYAEGDDEMKRTINKAWVESREKQYKGDIPMDIWKYSKGRLKTDLPCETLCCKDHRLHNLLPSKDSHFPFQVGENI